MKFSCNIFFPKIVEGLMRVIFFNGGRDNGVGTDEGRLVETMEEM